MPLSDQLILQTTSMSIVCPTNDISELAEKLEVCEMFMTWVSTKAYSF